MNSNQKGGQGSKGNNQADSSSGSRSGTQGGTHEQHVDAGRQSHKNDEVNQSSSGSGSSKQSDSSTSSRSSTGSKSGTGSRSGTSQSGTHEQHVDAGRQSHKNDK